ncbi:Anaphase-promoting complex (APC), subunit 10 [Ceraceosorus bombacis]|uniref:Anaphase-promoting complex (APC), subunit 10 n=1 Tax=Ceraceosorus bombacis TaxID=401625 RepID=A0A0P1BMC7_9BASI|nr:Anaphase-promoting complex (APC), subunit 10 [Ceraceosorus bombacis]
MGYYDVQNTSEKKEVGCQAGTMWSLSSYKPGCGVQALRSDDVETSWHSDGTQPHLINIQFSKSTLLTHISLHLNHSLDDSYTPSKILVRAGTHYHDLVDVRTRTLDKPVGWYHFALSKPSATHSEETDDEKEDAQLDAVVRKDKAQKGGGRASREEREGKSWRGRNLPSEVRANRPEPIQAYLLQVCIQQCHLNGKDTHVRGLKVWGPASASTKITSKSGNHSTSTTGLRSLRTGQDTGMGFRSSAFSNMVESSRTYDQLRGGEPHAATSTSTPSDAKRRAMNAQSLDRRRLRDRAKEALDLLDRHEIRDGDLESLMDEEEQEQSGTDEDDETSVEQKGARGNFVIGQNQRRTAPSREAQDVGLGLTGYRTEALARVRRRDFGSVDIR